MKIIKCSFIFDKWGLYILPILGYSWMPQEKSLWVGWLLWLWKIEFSL